jgi:hypothetical protein
MKIESPVSVLENVEFCQAHPVRLERGVVMQRSISSTLSKDLMILHPNITPINARAYWGAIGPCGLALSSGVPVYQSFYKMMIRSSRGEVF